MNWYETDENRIIVADVITKAWQDSEYKEALVAEPKKILQEAGITDIPEDLELRTVENTAKRQYCLLPAELSDDDWDKLSASMQGLLPLAEEQELVFVQNTANLNYLPIPNPPEYDNSLSAEELEAVSGGRIFVQIGVFVNVAAIASVRLAVVTQTSVF